VRQTANIKPQSELQGVCVILSLTTSSINIQFPPHLEHLAIYGHNTCDVKSTPPSSKMIPYLPFRGRPPLLPVNTSPSIPWCSRCERHHTERGTCFPSLELVEAQVAQLARPRHDANRCNHLRPPILGLHSYHSPGCQPHHFHNYHHQASPFNTRNDGTELSSRGYGYSNGLGSRDSFSATDFLRRWRPRSDNLSEIFIGNRDRYVFPYQEEHLRLRVVRQRGHALSGVSEEEFMITIPVTASFRAIYDGLGGGRDIEIRAVGRRYGGDRLLDDFRDMRDLINFDAEALVILEGRRGLW
jgi:hypothetical protein